ncbi:MAG: hypothetical protein GEV06_10130 [Luteitalea sp.]|nr:hypothetical protein [Luteitalea sp.]
MQRVRPKIVDKELAVPGQHWHERYDDRPAARRDLVVGPVLLLLWRRHRLPLHRYRVVEGNGSGESLGEGELIE